MKISSTINQLLSAAYVVVLLVFFSACSEEQVMPVPGEHTKESHITIRAEGSVNDASVNDASVNEGPVNPELIKIKVSQRDNIPLNQIETCNYYGQTLLGFWEYHLTTSYDGPKIYIVIQIIGDDCDGL